jgi:transketolase
MVEKVGSGFPATIEGLVGNYGYIHGMGYFGYSVPYKVLNEKFGFSGESVYKQVKQLIY